MWQSQVAMCQFFERDSPVVQVAFGLDLFESQRQVENVLDTQGQLTCAAFLEY
jgi:hypothetical protein